MNAPGGAAAAKRLAVPGALSARTEPFERSEFAPIDIMERILIEKSLPTFSEFALRNPI
jgi:hypothetical protein